MQIGAGETGEFVTLVLLKEAEHHCGGSAFDALIYAEDDQEALVRGAFLHLHFEGIQAQGAVRSEVQIHDLRPSG